MGMIQTKREREGRRHSNGMMPLECSTTGQIPDASLQSNMLFASAAWTYKLVAEWQTSYQQLSPLAISNHVTDIKTIYFIHSFIHTGKDLRGI